jgi:hypothetical protein
MRRQGGEETQAGDKGAHLVIDRNPALVMQFASNPLQG